MSTAGQEQKRQRKVVVVGAGPVGSLAALYAATRGDEVHVYDLRGDLRDPGTTPLNFTKSINLALSTRGITALEGAGIPGLLDSVLASTIPMYGRMIHGRRQTGELYEEEQLYDVHGRYQRAIDRSTLTNALLDALSAQENVSLHFNHKLIGADFVQKTARFKVESECELHQEAETKAGIARYILTQSRELEVPFDLLLGCDGAHSMVRYQMMKFAQIDYSQSYIDALWCEFRIAPVEDKTWVPKQAAAFHPFRISPNHLHIWPSSEKRSMFIAIPSRDGSFTCTLFAPATVYAALSTSASKITHFFDAAFAGVTELISSGDLAAQLSTNPHLPLLSASCSPTHVRDCGVLLGDAAHAMVPFYGQGMNCGLEDVRCLFETLDKTANDVSLAAFDALRIPDTRAVVALSLANFVEMRSGVLSPLYRARKRIEELLSLYVPACGWATQYARVSFTTQPYHDVVRDVRRQGRVLAGVALAAAATVGITAAWAVMSSLRRHARLEGLAAWFMQRIRGEFAP